MKPAEKPHVLIAYPLRPRFMQALETRYTLHRLDQATDKDAVLAQAGPVCTAMVVNGHVTVDAAMLDKLPALKLAACSSAGFDLFDRHTRMVSLTSTGQEFPPQARKVREDLTGPRAASATAPR